MKIIKQREFHEGFGYHRVYGVKSSNEMFYSFECDENGIVNENKLHPDGLSNYKLLEEGKKIVNGKTLEFLEIRKDHYSYYDNAIGICEVCECKVELSDPMTNTCDCGAEYNRSGQRLEDRRLWDDTDGATSPDYE